ncbi:MAG: hypothetical protein EXQ79_08875 [Acidimicrobiia bacterium]|nr:hypothetical protein [Acidimicrobiia bacterium]
MAVHRSLPLGNERGAYGTAAASRRCRRCGIVIGYGERCDFCVEQAHDHEDGPGEHLGRHHTEWIPTVEALIGESDLDAAEFLLWQLVEATEQETLTEHVPPLELHFRRLGWIARQRGDEALAVKLRKRSAASKASSTRSSASDAR